MGSFREGVGKVKISCDGVDAVIDVKYDESLVG